MALALQSSHRMRDLRVVRCFIIFFGILAGSIGTPMAQVAAEPNLNGKTAFEVLGVSKSDSNKAIEKVYRKLAMRYHTDRQPHTNDLAQRQIQEENFKKIKACFEAIENLDETLLTAFNLTLGLTDAEIRQRGGNFSSNSSSSSSPEPSDWFKKTVDKNENLKGDVSIEHGLFKDRIFNFYQNEDGVIIQTVLNQLFWIPRNSRIVYPVHAHLLGSVDDANGFMYDTRDSEGIVPITIDPKSVTLRVRDLVFYGQNVKALNTDKLNFDLAHAGYELATDGQIRGNADLNVWQYSIFFDGEVYTILARTSNRYEKGQSTIKYKLFVGNWNEIVEIPIYNNHHDLRLEVPSRGVHLKFSDSNLNTPFFDSVTGFHMGRIGLSPGPLFIFKLSSPNQQVRAIPALSREEIYKLPLVGLLAKHIELPKILRTPLDRHWIRAERSKEFYTHMPLLTGQRSESQVAPVSISAPKESAPKELTSLALTDAPPTQSNQTQDPNGNIIPAGWSEWRKRREMKDAFPDVGVFLEYPDGDKRREIAEFLLRGNIKTEELRTLLINHIDNHAAVDVLSRFYSRLNNWEILEALMFLPEMILERHSSDAHFIVPLVRFEVRNLIAQSPLPIPPRLNQLIFKLRSLTDVDVNPYLDSYLEAKRRAPQPAIKGASLNLFLESDCVKLLTSE